MTKNDLPDGYPLQWPEGVPRTPPHRRDRARFGRLSTGLAIQELVDELQKPGMRARHVVISSNLPLRRDGLPYANTGHPSDPGVAVYWLTQGGERRVMACDRWHRLEHNMRALTKSIDALRGLSRWGGTDIVDRAFSGFAALPAFDWRSVLGPVSSPEEAKARYRALAREVHPDHGGSSYDMQRLSDALEAAMTELGS